MAISEEVAFWPRRAAVLGSPISHSQSPALHRAAYAALGLPWTYQALEVTASGLAEFVDSMDETWAGLSLTMPLKETILDMLVELDPVAHLTRAVNTVLPGRGGWRGANTDVFGMVASLREAGVNSLGGSALILGAGATARSAVASAAELGITRVTICARTQSAARSVQGVAASFELESDTAEWEPSSLIAEVDLVISTVPGDAASAWVQFISPTGGALLDASYHPWPSALASAWPSKVIASGRDMLLWQAAEQVHLMTGLEAPVEAMRAALSST